MATIADLKRTILQSSDGNQEVPLDVYQLATRFTIPVNLVCDTFVDLFRQNLVSLTAWDGSRRVPFNQWSLAKDFFSSGLDTAVWVQLRAAGKQWLEAKSAEENRTGVFISHSTAEHQVATKLKGLIERVFGPKFVFLSSDLESLRGGDDWYPGIVKALKTSKVTVALVSRDSIGSRWINFEAGVAVGAHESMPVIPVVFAGLQLGEIGQPLSPRMGRSLGSTAEVRALLQDIALHTATKLPDKAADREIEAFLLDIKSSVELTKARLLPEYCSASYGAVGVLFKLHNGGSKSIRPSCVEIEFPFSWLASGGRPAIAEDVLGVEDRNKGATVFRRMAYRRTDRTPNPLIDGFTPLPSIVNPKDTITLKHLLIEILRNPPRERDVSLHYRIYADDADVAEGDLSFDDLV
jgi:TIR domain